MDRVVDSAQLSELMIAIRRLLEGARLINGREGPKVLVERVDFDRLNELAAQVPASW